jgi:putative membrane protein
MKTRSLFLLSIISFLFACGNAEQKHDEATAQPITSNDTNIIKKSDAKMKQEDKVTFLTNAAIGGMMEVEASSRILVNTKNNPAVLAHAKMIKDDHMKANEELKTIAQKENFTLPTVLPEAKLKLLKQLESLKDEAQNEFYINLMVTEHNDAINLFNLGSTMPIESISSFATKTLPILKHHYDMTVSIRDAILKEKANQGDDPLKISDKRKNNAAKNQ